MIKKTSRIVIISFIYFIAFVSILPLLGNENQADWFATGLHEVFVLVFWITFFIVSLVIGFVLNRSKINISKETLVYIIKYSFFGVVLIIGYGIIIYTIDYDNWNKESEIKRELFEKTKLIMYNNSVDSLISLINVDSTNSNAYFELGLTYRHNGEWNKSIVNYKRAIIANSNISKFHSELAYSESIVGNYGVAIKEYEIAYLLDANKTWILSDIERCRRMEMKFSDKK